MKIEQELKRNKEAFDKGLKSLSFYNLSIKILNENRINPSYYIIDNNQVKLRIVHTFSLKTKVDKWYVLKHIQKLIKKMLEIQTIFLKKKCKKLKYFKSRKTNTFGFRMKKSTDELILKIGYAILNINKESARKYNQVMQDKKRPHQKVVLKFKNNLPSFYIYYKNAKTNRIIKIIRISDHKRKSSLPWFKDNNVYDVIYDVKKFKKLEKKGELTWDNILKDHTFPEL